MGPSRSDWSTSRSWQQRHYATFSVIVADVDNLKALNDSSGHHGGDRALRLLAGVLRQAARETDVVGRLGGDEFALLLHETDQAAAMAAATRLHAALHDVTGSDRVTASFGISTWLGPNDGPDALLRRADEALYVAKRNGRNRAALWEPPAKEAAGAAVVEPAPSPPRRPGTSARAEVVRLERAARPDARRGAVAARQRLI